MPSPTATQLTIRFPIVLYTHIWNTTLGDPLTVISPALSANVGRHLMNAIQNWKVVWDEVRAASTIDEWQALGFQRTADVYWQLSKAVLIAFERGIGRDLLPIASDCDEIGLHLRRLLSGGGE